MEDDARLRPPEALVLGQIDRPEAVLYLTDSPRRSKDSRSIPTALLSSLQPIVQRAGDLLSAGNDMRGKTLRIVFSPDVTRSLNRGTAKLVEDAGGRFLPVARDAKSGRFIEIGKSAVKKGARFAGLAAMAWQVATIVTAQHYLKEISVRLDRIESALDEIRFHLDEEKRATLRACVTQLRHYKNAISRGELHEGEIGAIVHQLEYFEHTCLSIAELGEGLHNRKLEQLDHLGIGGPGVRADHSHRAAIWVQECEAYGDWILMAHSCRILGCLIKAALPGDRLILRERIKHSLDAISALERSFAGTEEAFRQRVEVLNRRTKSILALNGSFDTDYRPRLWLAHENARSRRKKTSKGVHSEGKQVLSLLNRFDTLSENGLHLELTMGPSGEWRVVDAQPCEPMLEPHGEIDDGGEIPENIDEIVQDILRRAREAKEQKSESRKRKPER